MRATEPLLRAGSSMNRSRSRAGAQERGFTFVLVLAAVALVAAGAAKVGVLWSEAAQREREEELLRVGQAYAEAVASYLRASPGNVKQYPPSMQDLLADPRVPGTRRHLRRLYADPLDPNRPWGVIPGPNGGIAGVYSQDSRQPWRRASYENDLISLPAAQAYSDWKFVPRSAT
jgi:type II secretory pathway pseudopilin PulG